MRSIKTVCTTSTKDTIVKHCKQYHLNYINPLIIRNRNNPKSKNSKYLILKLNRVLPIRNFNLVKSKNKLEPKILKTSNHLGAYRYFYDKLSADNRLQDAFHVSTIKLEELKKLGLYNRYSQKNINTAYEVYMVLGWSVVGVLQIVFVDTGKPVSKVQFYDVFDITSESVLLTTADARVVGVVKVIYKPVELLLRAAHPITELLELQTLKSSNSKNRNHLNEYIIRNFRSRIKRYDKTMSDSKKLLSFRGDKVVMFIIRKKIPFFHQKTKDVVMRSALRHYKMVALNLFRKYIVTESYERFVRANELKARNFESDYDEVLNMSEDLSTISCKDYKRSVKLLKNRAVPGRVKRFLSALLIKNGVRSSDILDTNKFISDLSNSLNVNNFSALPPLPLEDSNALVKPNPNADVLDKLITSQEVELSPNIIDKQVEEVCEFEPYSLDSTKFNLSTNSPNKYIYREIRKYLSTLPFDMILEFLGLKPVTKDSCDIINTIRYFYKKNGGRFSSYGLKTSLNFKKIKHAHLLNKFYGLFAYSFSGIRYKVNNAPNIYSRCNRFDDFFYGNFFYYPNTGNKGNTVNNARGGLKSPSSNLSFINVVSEKVMGYLDTKKLQRCGISTLASVYTALTVHTPYTKLVTSMFFYNKTCGRQFNWTVQTLFYKLIFKFKKSYFFVTLMDSEGRIFFSLHVGLLLRFFNYKKSLKKSTSFKMLLMRYLRKLLLVTGINNFNLYVRQSSNNLTKLIKILQKPLSHPFLDPLTAKYVVEVNTKRSKSVRFNFMYMIFLKTKPYGVMKTKKIGRIKRKITRKVMKLNNIID